MSEYSDCFYILNEDTQKMEHFLEKIKRFGIMLESGEKWTPFLIEPEYDYPQNISLFSYDGPLLSWHFGEDHGIYADFYLDSKKIHELSIMKKGASIVPPNSINEMEPFFELDAAKLDSLQEIIDDSKLDTSRDLFVTRNKLSNILSINLIQGTTSHQLEVYSIKELKKRYPGATFIMSA